MCAPLVLGWPVTTAIPATPTGHHPASPQTTPPIGDVVVLQNAMDGSRSGRGSGVIFDWSHALGSHRPKLSFPCGSGLLVPINACGST